MDAGLTLTELSQFTGKPTTEYGLFITEALLQAGDLFELATDLATLPESGIDLRVAKRGILSLAEALYEGQQYRSLRFSPMRSETIGSYSYTLVEASIRQGIPTGISWFDIAVDRFSPTSISESSISVFDRPGDIERIHDMPSLIGPADTDDWHGSPRLYRNFGT